MIGWIPKRKAAHSDIDWPKSFVQLAEQASDPRLQRYYAQGAVAGTTPLREVPFVALDFETTGLNAESDEIISIGLVCFDLKRIYAKQAAHWVINPQCPLSDESVVIHQITDTEVNSAPSLEQVLESVLKALAGKVVVVHYKNIERQFLYQGLLRRIGEGVHFPLLDTLDIEAGIQRQQCAGLLNFIKGKRPGSLRLARARERYNLPYYTAHHALTDALATAELLQAQIAYYFDADLPVSQFWQ